MVRYVCNNCGYASIETDLIDVGSICPNCDGHFIDAQDLSKADVSDMELDASGAATQAKRLNIEFTGSAGEYFRIWIVNTFLTIVTVGIYAAWAKVRSRQYFYRNTVLDGHAFDYTANPGAILKGHLIIAAGLGLYKLLNTYNQILGLGLAGLLSLAFPFLVYKSLRFFAHNSSFRNVRFQFLGTLGESYRTYLFLPFFVPFTLGLIIPYWAFRKKKYFFDNFAYGTTGNSFAGRPWPFYRAYASAVLTFVIFIIVCAALVMFFVPHIKDSMPFDKGTASKMAAFLPFVGVLLILPLSIFIQQKLYAWTTNYCLGHSNLGKLRLQSTLKGTRLFWISITNILLMVVSLGLLTPWAKVRRMRYVLGNLAVITDGSLDDFMAAAAQGDGSIGEAATDLFDIDLGL